MAKFSTGLFAGAVIGMGVAMIDHRAMRRARKMAKSMIRGMKHCCM